MTRRNLLAAGAIIAGVVVLWFAVCSPRSDEEKIIATLEQLASTLSFVDPIENPVFHGSYLGREFEETVADQIHVSVSEVATGIPRQRGRLALATAQLLTRYGSLQIGLSGYNVAIGDTASVEATATVTAVVAGSLRRDKRPVSFELIRNGGDWLVSRVMVRAPE